MDAEMLSPGFYWANERHEGHGRTIDMLKMIRVSGAAPFLRCYDVSGSEGEAVLVTEQFRLTFLERVTTPASASRN
jgi:hypothetical protein